MRWIPCFLIFAVGCGGEGPGARASNSSGGTSANAGAGGSGTVSGGGGGTTNAAAGTAGTTSSAGTTATGGASAGGSVGSGGSGGGGGNPVTVLGCDELPAAGTWDFISPPEWAVSDKNQAFQVAVDPQVAGVVYAAAGDKTNGGTGGTGLYKSTNCGATWAKVSTGMNGDKLETGCTWTLVVDPSDSNVIYATNGYGSPASLFKSENGGVDWIDLFPEDSEIVEAIGTNFIQGFSLDPTNSQHFLVTLHANCTGAYAPMCLIESTNGGDTFRAFIGPADGWLEAGGPILLGPTTFLYGSQAGVFYTSNGGEDWEQVADTSWGGIYTTTEGKMLLGGPSGIMQSDDGHAWTHIDGSPQATGLTGYGSNIYASFQNDSSGKPIRTASVADLGTWSSMDTPDIPQGGGSLKVDAEHHVLYAALWSGGLWRYVIE